jgi:peptidyl-prolyl cis-trans isomerase A (cyclophilin A)
LSVLQENARAVFIERDSAPSLSPANQPVKSTAAGWRFILGTRAKIRSLKPLISFLLLALSLAAQDRAEKPMKPGLYALFRTSEGIITARLFEKDTPIAVRNFVALAQGDKPSKDAKTGAMVKRPLYDNITFHRVLPDLMIQSGDPTGTGSHDCGILIRDEILPGLRFDGPGKLAVANTGNPDSGGCQFFITTDTMRQWNDKYTIFGIVVSGIEVANKISHAPVRGDKPVNPAKLLGVTIQRVGPEPKK